MNSFLNKNLELFGRRFPALYDFVRGQNTAAAKADISVVGAKSGVPTLMEKGIYLHSMYDPVKEGRRLVTERQFAQCGTAVFEGMGLAYGPSAYAQAYPQSVLVVIEPDIERFYLAMETVDLAVLFAHPALVLLLAAPVPAVIPVLERLGLNNCYIYRNPALTAGNAEYFDTLTVLIDRNREKAAINMHTLEKFGRLWLRNMCRNLNEIRDKKGVIRYAGRGKNIPACVLAAGPSLDEILPQLAEIKERFLLICVDTALKACLSAGVQPDIIILIDPQYWNYRHLDRLRAPESILITESAAWPAVFRFECKEIVLCSSLFPLGKFLEKRTEIKGELGAGGSVSTTAWDFARLAGCPQIVMAGLDLGFPGNKTHFKGSTFEERVHLFSGRLKPAETDSCRTLYGADAFYASDYRGGKVLTDRRLSLYAWWFESKCAAGREIQTATLSPLGLRIPGIGVTSVQDMLDFPVCRAEIASFLEGVPEQTVAEAGAEAHAFSDAVREAALLLEEMRRTANEAAQLCRRGIRCLKSADKRKKTHIEEILAELSELDRRMLSSEGNELTSMIFPGSDTLARGLSPAMREDTSPEGILRISEYTYTEISESAGFHLQALKGC